MAQSAGTVSRILWHFTGGPKWDAAKNKQESKPKPAHAAYGALLSILKSKELRVGQYHEVVKVRVPVLRKYNEKTRKLETQKNAFVELGSRPVCCLSDIPIAHLSYHAQRYGRFALGFHRDAAVTHGFNPVFYTLHDTRVLRSVYEGFAHLSEIEVDPIESAADELETETSAIECERGHEIDLDISQAVGDIQSQAEWIGGAVTEAQESFEKFLAFVKTFDQDEFSTIYCEREWRSVESFSFSFDQLAMIVLPRLNEKQQYFSKFVSRDAKRLKFPGSIPVVPWEDLIEH